MVTLAVPQRETGAAEAETAGIVPQIRHCPRDKILTLPDWLGERLMRCGHPEFAFKYIMLRRRDRTVHVFHILYCTTVQSDHPSILGAGLP